MEVIMLKGNKGEWSEIYVLFRLLADGKIYAADSELNKLDDIFFPILEILRKEVENETTRYVTGDPVTIYVGEKLEKEVSAENFNAEADSLLNEITDKKAKGAFTIERTENFMNDILCFKISAPATDKRDITMKIKDINTGYTPVAGFSIKSELGKSPTLLNAGKTTNFIYRIIHDYPGFSNEMNSIYKYSGEKKHIDVRGRLKMVAEKDGILEYVGMENETFKKNLELIDSNMDKIIAETILYFYRDGISNCIDMVEKLEDENPMNYENKNAYRYKFKKFLTAVALGMKPATEWDGIDDATGGYIIVTKNGNVLAYHIYNRNSFEEYLLQNTKFETASTSRHEFGEVYSIKGDDYIKLNLQVRFK